MPNYGKQDFKESNVNYLNKDFISLKESLMNYAKSYFPDTYRDFNETSPGMMLLEMNAYVGDVLSFYIDKQYQEMLLPLAEERRNIITMAKMFGYKVKPIVPSFVDLNFTSNVNVLSTDESQVDYNNAGVFDSGIQIQSSTNSSIVFTTLQPIDFKLQELNDTNTIGTTADSGVASTYTLTRTVKAISATTKTISFQIGIPEKFKTLIIPDTNVVEIVSCIDSNNNKWYEVDFLAQHRVPIETHYTNDIDRTSPYDDDSLAPQNINGVAVPSTLQYIETNKRFTRETNLDNTTSLVFGNGLLNNGVSAQDQGLIDLEQAGITIPGQGDLNDAIDSSLGDDYATLGEAPNNTTLTITYRVGGGINSNVPANDLTTGVSAIESITPSAGSSTLTTVNNLKPATGGKDEEDTVEIREKTKAFFASQNRCVTAQDFEARILNLPSKFGGIAKVYVTSGNVESLGIADNYFTQLAALNGQFTNLESLLNGIPDSSEELTEDEIISNFNTLQTETPNLVNNVRTALNNMPQDFAQALSTVNIYLLAFNGRKELFGNPHFPANQIPNLLMTNVDLYLNNFKILTDSITFNDGYIVNFGVIFDIIAQKYADKQQVKINCIQKIKDYFRIENMKFNEPIYKSQLEYELMGIEGVLSIGHVTITQYEDSPGYTDTLNFRTYKYEFSDNSDDLVDLNGDGVKDGAFVESDNGTDGYGYRYDFLNALSDDGTIIVPPNTATPTVFELKNPNQTIQGRVR